MTQGEKKYAHEFLVPCLAGDVAHATVLHTMIQDGSTSYEALGITPEDLKVFRALSGITDHKERARVAFRGCRDGKVLACFGVIQHLMHAEQVTIADLIEGDNSFLQVGSDLTHFCNEHSAHLARILPREEHTQD